MYTNDDDGRVEDLVVHAQDSVEQTISQAIDPRAAFGRSLA